MTDRETLARKIEAADASEQRAMLEAAWAFIHGVPAGVAASDERVGHWLRFVNMLAAEAYESAAMMLVPEGWRLTNMGEQDIDDQPPWAVHLSERNAEFGRAKSVWAYAATPALALSAAAVRAGGE